MPTRWLSCHVHYACRHSGVCCTAGWPLPVEDAVVPAIADAVTRGRLTTIDGRTAWLLESAEAPAGMAGTLRQAGGACVFHRPRADASSSVSPAHECAVHATLGHDALPSTCQHFPRVALIDDRGVRVSLSHVCPTALDLLVSHDGPVRIVDGPPAVPGRDVPEGLDARGELPPALNDRVLMDLDTVSLWEAHVVATLAGLAAPAGLAEEIVGMLTTQADGLAAWTPGGASLADAAHDVLARPALPYGGGDDVSLARRLHARVVDTCRAPWTWRPAPADLETLDARWGAPAWRALAPLVRRYLATRAFGAWAQYQAGDLAGSVRWLRVVLAVLRVEAARVAADAGRVLDRPLLGRAIRQSDLLLLHYGDGAAVARVGD